MDLQICWRFFKYKLVLDEIRTKFKRDRALLQSVMDRGQSLDVRYSNLEGQILPGSSQENQRPADGKQVAHSKMCNCCPCNADTALKATDHSALDRSATNHCPWMLPCSIERVVKRIDHLLPEIDALTQPLSEINQMIHSL